MTGLFKYMARRRALARFPETRTDAVSLSAVSTVALYLDRNRPDWAACERKVRSYFEDQGKTVHTVIINFLDTDYLGRRRRTSTDPAALGKEDLLISLVPECSFTMTYEVVSSEAGFKIGIAEPRRQKIYDLVVRDSSGGKKSPMELFDSVVELLEKFR